MGQDLVIVFFSGNDVLACCVLGRGRGGVSFCASDRMRRYNGSDTPLSFWWLNDASER